MNKELFLYYSPDEPRGGGLTNGPSDPKLESGGKRPMDETGETSRPEEPRMTQEEGQARIDAAVRRGRLSGEAGGGGTPGRGEAVGSPLSSAGRSEQATGETVREEPIDEAALARAGRFLNPEAERELRRQMSAAERRSPYELPKSLEDLMRQVAKEEKNWEWNKGERRSLIHTEKRWVKRKVKMKPEEGGGFKEVIEQLDVERADLANVLDWVRNQVMYFHKNNKLAPMEFFSTIQLYTSFRAMSLVEMLFYGKNFNIEKDAYDSKGELITNEDDGTAAEVFFGNPNDALNVEEREKAEEKENARYTQVHDQIVRELWLYTELRNYDLGYKKNMGSDKQLPQYLNEAKFNLESILTQGDFLQFIFSMPTHSGWEEGNTRVGNIARRIFSAYRHLADVDTLQKIMTVPDGKGGKTDPLDSVLFQKGYKIVKDNKLTEKDAGLEDHGAGWKESWFDRETGRLRVTDEQSKNEFARYINIFRDKEKDPDTINEVRNRLRLSFVPVIQRELEEVFDKEKEQLVKQLEEGKQMTGDQIKAEVDRRRVQLKYRAYEQADYAEEWAWAFARPFWFGARNDTQARGYDAMTKEMEFQKYRDRMPERAGLLGNPFNMGGVKRLSLDLAATISTRSVRKPMLDSQGKVMKDANKETMWDVERDKKSGNLVPATSERRMLGDVLEGKDKNGNMNFESDLWELRFDENTMLDAMVDHERNANAVFHSMTDRYEMDFHKIGQVDRFGRLVYIEQEKLNQVMDGLWHQIRYAFSTFSQFHFEDKVRVLKKVHKPEETGKPYEIYEYEDVPVAKAFFGNELLKNFTDKNGIIDYKSIQDQGNDPKLWKEAIKYLVKAEIMSHARMDSPYPLYSMAEMDVVYDALRKIPGKIMYDENDMRRTQITEPFFNKREIGEFKRDTNTGTWRMFRNEMATAFLSGAWSGFWKTLSAKNLWALLEISEELRGIG